MNEDETTNFNESPNLDHEILSDDSDDLLPGILPGNEGDAPLDMDVTNALGFSKPNDVPNQIGPYKLQELLGAGGMGEVWVAEQSEPVKRRVALKLIKGGIGSKEIIARFDAERQALALMNHPNIARILDAGTTGGGQPFFVMELVAGKPLTTYCDENKLSIDERLKLFTDVCAGVQHAHQKGIIHRDLKPGNVIVGIQDGKAVPKIIDFGLAKAMESTQRLTDQSLFTGIGQILGTLKYMSPEQASLDGIDIDTRTDIYALGVILYELLTGSTPLDESSVKGQAALQVLEFIRDKEPAKPSSRLTSSTNKQVSSITSVRKTDSGRLTRILSGDLDWIVLKALEKDRTRRYESASGFSEDIHRFLNNDPVVARPPSVNYRVRKFVRKNRVGVLAASLVTLVLFVGIVGTTLAMFRARTAEKLAESRLEDAIAARLGEAEQRKLAESQRMEAEQNLAYAKKGNEILGSVFVGLDPNAEYQDVSELRNALRDNLVNAVKELEGSAIGDPLTVSEMQITLGISLEGLGETEQAISLFQRAFEARSDKLGPDHVDTLISMSELAMGYQAAAQMDKALPLLKQTYEMMKAKLGPEHPETVTSMGALATGFLDVGQLDKALPLLEQTFALLKTQVGIDDPETLNAMNSLAMGYFEVGQRDKALLLLEEGLQLQTSKLGPGHPDTLLSINNLAGFYWAAGNSDKALPLFEKTLELSEDQLGPEHPETLSVMNNLAAVYHATFQPNKALPLLERTLKLQMSKLGPRHPETLSTVNNLAHIYRVSGQVEKALPLLKQTLEIRIEELGPNHPDTLRSMTNLAGGYKAAGQLDKALPLMEEATEKARAKLGPNHPDTLQFMHNLLSAYATLTEVEKFDQLFPAAIKRRNSFPADSLPLANYLMGLARNFLKLNRGAEAETLLRESMSISERKGRTGRNLLRNTQSLLGEALLVQSKTKEGLEKTKLLDKAESLLVNTYQEMQQSEDSNSPKINNQLSETLDRLIDLYETLGNPDKIERYRKLRQSTPANSSNLDK